MPQTIDKELVKRRFRRSLASYDGAAVVQNRMASRLVEMLTEVTPQQHFRSAFEVGCGTGLLTRKLLGQLKPEQILVNDFVGECRDGIGEIARDYPHCRVGFIEGDAETVAMPEQLDLVVSNATFQWLSDVDRFIARASEALMESGVLAVATFGQGTLREIADITGISLEYHSADDYRRMLGDGFNLLAEENRIDAIRLESPRAILRHLQKCGVTGVSSTPWSREDFRKFENEYRKKYCVSGKAVLTYCPLYFVARKRQSR